MRQPEVTVCIEWGKSDMIIWNGLGFLVVVVAFVCLLATEFLCEAVFQDDQYYQTHKWPAFVALLVAATIVWFLGRRLEKKGSRRLIDPETNETVILQNDHSLFWIRMEYWGAILLGLAVAFLFWK